MSRSLSGAEVVVQNPKLTNWFSDSLSFPESSVTVACANVVFFLRLDFVSLSFGLLLRVSTSSSS
jgi:hypothetical protein